MTDAEKIEALKAGYALLSGMVWKFCDMSYLEDDPADPDNAILAAADEACR